jgi:hypothetical protein
MPTPGDIARTAVLVVTRDILPPIVERLEAKIQKQDATIEILKQQVAELLEKLAK